MAGLHPAMAPSEAHWARGGVLLTSLAPHGHPAGRNCEQVYENTEESLSEEASQGVGALAMPGGEGHPGGTGWEGGGRGKP